MTVDRRQRVQNVLTDLCGGRPSRPGCCSSGAHPRERTRILSYHSPHVRVRLRRCGLLQGRLTLPHPERRGAHGRRRVVQTFRARPYPAVKHKVRMAALNRAQWLCNHSSAPVNACVACPPCRYGERHQDGIGSLGSRERRQRYQPCEGVPAPTCHCWPPLPLHSTRGAP